MWHWGQGRYSRQEAIPLLGESGQARLSAARVTVVGAGGVKSPLLYYLAAAGVGRIRVVDFDRVELSNLNRQILYTTADVGRYKAEAAAERLHALNPEIAIEPVVAQLNADNFDAITENSDLLFEGGDSAAARREFNRLALAAQKPYIHASAQFNYAYVVTVLPYQSACFDCFFDDLPGSHGGPVPVLGCATGIAGSVAAAEAISILCGKGAQLSNRLWLHDGWSNESVNLPMSRRESCPACGKSAPNIAVEADAPQAARRSP